MVNSIKKFLKNIPIENTETLFNEKIESYCAMNNVINLSYNEISELLDKLHNYNNLEHKVLKYNNVKIKIITDINENYADYELTINDFIFNTCVMIKIEYIKFRGEITFKCNLLIKNYCCSCKLTHKNGIEYKPSFRRYEEFDYEFIKKEIMDHIEKNYKLKPTMKKSARSVFKN